MLPKYHLFFGAIFSTILFLFFPSMNLFTCGVIFLSTFLIDLDHYVYYFVKTKNINPFKTIKYFLDKKNKMEHIPKSELRKYYTGFYFLHGIETLILLVIFGIFVSKTFYLIFVGFVFHLSLDWIDEIYYDKRIDKISSVYDFIKFRRLTEIK